MDNSLYLLLRKGAVAEYERESIEEIINTYGLDWRTIKGLIKIINNELGITSANISGLFEKGFYTFENMVRMAKNELLDIIPGAYFENEQFLKAAGIDYLPTNFMAGNIYIKEFKVPSVITHISDNAFMGCTFLKTVHLPDTLTSIGSGAFKNCPALNLNALPDNVNYLGAEAFKNCHSIKELTLPNILRIEDGTFKNCHSLQIVNSNNNLRVGREAFSGCGELTGINAQIVEAKEAAFEDCVSLKEINLRTSTIGCRAFSGCKNLSIIHFRGIIPSRLKKDCFIGCNSIRHVEAEGFSYQVRESIGYKELNKNIHPLKSSDGRIAPSFTIHSSRSVKEILECL